jgi:hypothetical protein
MDEVNVDISHAFIDLTPGKHAIKPYRSIAPAMSKVNDQELRRCSDLIYFS